MESNHSIVGQLKETTTMMPKLSKSANIFALAQKVHSINAIILTSWASGLWRKWLSGMYGTEDPIADKRADHAHSIKLRIQELLASHGIFFVAIYTNDETQRLTFAQVSKAKSRLYDIRIRVHVYPPHVPEESSLLITTTMLALWSQQMSAISFIATVNGCTPSWWNIPKFCLCVSLQQKQEI